MHFGSKPFPGRTCFNALRISGPFEFSWCPNWLVGKAKTTSFSPYFWQSSFICVKSRTVVPHNEAVFSMRTTLPLRSEKRNWKIIKENWQLLNVQLILRRSATRCLDFWWFLNPKEIFVFVYDLFWNNIFTVLEDWNVKTIRQTRHWAIAW